MCRKFKTSIVAIATVLGLSVVVYAAGTQVRLEGPLNPTVPQQQLASGKVKFEKGPNRVRFSAEVEDLVAVVQVNVIAAGVLVGTVTVDAAGGADLNLDSQNGNNVPVLVAGDVVQIRNQANGTVILSGVLVPR